MKIRCIPSKTDLDESVEVHSELNPKLWNSDNTLKEDVCEKLNNISQEFLKYIEIPLNVIDIENWKRKEYFKHFTNYIPCTYSLTAKINVTNLKKLNMKFYPALIYCITLTVNKYKEFRTAYNSKGLLGYYDKMIPCYTVFNTENELFYNLWTNMYDVKLMSTFVMG